MDGVTISRMIESMSIVKRTIPEDAFSIITNHCTTTIKEIYNLILKNGFKFSKLAPSNIQLFRGRKLEIEILFWG